MPLDPYAVKGFGSGADEYDRYRPGWPAEAVDGALARCGLGPDAVLMDLAAGTGKLTRLLVTRAERVIAVEPLEDMRRLLEQAAPDADAVTGTADEIPVEDGSVDAVFTAEAFHWFATREAVAEMGRVIRPGGGLVLMWNVHAFEDAPWTAAVGPVIAEFVPRAALANDRNSPERWGEVFEGSEFGPLSKFEVPNEQRTDVDGFIGHVMTWSHTRAMPQDGRDALAGGIREAFGREQPPPPEIVIRYRTEVYCALRSG
jgi:ubiquinone/menaquinone biosynthesis C-methylase UbiE